MSQEIKLAFLGDCCVGKTPLIIQATQHFFLQEWDPTVEDTYRMTRIIKGTTYLLSVLDTCGQTEYSPLKDDYMQHAEGFFVVYSITIR